MEFNNILKKLRKQENVSQETLAESLGISTQAVSKWECGLSYPDIELLPTLAEYFKTSIDFLLTGLERPFAGLCDCNNFHDGVLYIVQYKNGKVLSKDKYDPDVKIMLGSDDAIDGSVEIWGSANIEGDIRGNVAAGDGVNCGNVGGGVAAGDGVNCGNIKGGGVTAGDGVICGNVGGSVTAGDNVTCGNIGGSVNADGKITCANIKGDVITAGGDIHCHEVKGSIHNAKTVRIKKLAEN